MGKIGCMSTIRGNVLIVEDDRDCGQLISQALTANGYGVRIVKSRDDAVDALGRYLYSYIILDHAMPGMSVETFLEHCRKVTSNIILVSAVVDPKKEAERLRLKSWLRKPFDTEELLEIMRGLSSGVQKAPEPPL